MSFWVHGVVRLLLFLSFAPVACNLAATTNLNPQISSSSSVQSDFSGVWVGTSITSCTPLRMTGPWRCGSKADIKLTLIRKPAAAITGVFASVRVNAGGAFEQTGRICRVASRGRHKSLVARDHARLFELLVQWQFAWRGDGGELSLFPQCDFC